MFLKNFKSLTRASTHLQLQHLLLYSISINFSICIYTVDASVNDLECLKNLINYKETDAEVAEAAFKKLLSHRWYLTEETVAFCFFSDNSLVSIKIKESMALRLLSTTVPDKFRCRIPVFKGTVDEQTQLLDFVGPETWFLLKVLNLEQSWLNLSLELWPTSDS